MHGVQSCRATLRVGALGCLLAGSAVAAPQLPHVGGAGISEQAAVPAVLESGVFEPRAETADAARPAVTTARLNLREGPDTSYGRVALLPAGRPLHVLKEEGNWLFVSSSEETGWVYRDYVRVEPNPYDEIDTQVELAKLRSQQDGWLGERAILEERIGKLEEDREALQSALREMRGEVDFRGAETAAEGDSEPVRRRGLFGGARAQSVDVGAIREERDRFESERSDLQAELAAVRRELGEQSASADLKRRELERELERSQTELAELRDRFAEATISAETLASMEALRAQFESMETQMQRELAASEQARESLWANVSALRDENAELKRRLNLEGGGAPAVPVEPLPLVPSESLEDRVRAWADAWASQDVDSYLAFYSDDFDSGAKSRSDWRSERASRVGGPDFIRIELGTVSIERDSADGGSARATTTFVQSYESDRFSDRVRKTLEWVDEAGVWRIARERSTTLR